ncbi:hypothetical protein [Verrucomicrobium sp. BvORR034]|uniref:hypothetical protein n=1 Tax=Verrucomicrobium sp. BvORR034 TaxID=1396418 RepID=UPI0006789594|nr:hypothetical protein [Verrucomicrobium sp. BvORR034]
MKPKARLEPRATNSLPSTTVLTDYSANSVAETTALDLAEYNQTLAGLTSVIPTGANDVVAVTNSSSTTLSTLTINQSTALTYFGRITGNLALVKPGNGTLTRANTCNTTTPTATTNTYTEKTTISGTLALSGTGNNDGTPWIQIDRGAVFSVSGRTTGSYTLTNKTLSGTGSVTGTLNLERTGVIKVELASGYSVQWADVFNLVDWTALGANTGKVSDYLDLSSLADLGNGWYFSTDLFLTEGIIYVVPEPTRAVLFLLAPASITNRRRRTSHQGGVVS